MAASQDSTLKISFMTVTAGEWTKLSKQRGFIWFALLTVIASVGSSVLLGTFLRDEWSRDPVMALSFAISLPSSNILMLSLLLGLGLCIWLAYEFVSGSNYLTLLAVPQRRLLFIARLALIVALSVMLVCANALISVASTFFLAGPGIVVQAASKGGFWWSILAAMTVSLSVLLMFFGITTLMQKSLPAVGVIFTLFFALPGVAMVAYFRGFTQIESVTAILPAPLVADALKVVPIEGIDPTFSFTVAWSLLALWSLLFVGAAAWSFFKYE